MRPGDAALWRSIAFGRVRWAMAHRLVELTPEQVVLWVPRGTRGKRGVAALHECVDLSTFDWSLREGVWRDHCLKLTRFGDAHSLWLFWDEDGTFGGWYVNLQEPLRESPLGWDSRDHALDIVIEPDGRWAWKDEEHLAAATARGRFTPEEGAAILAEGERVLADPPWPTGWEKWRPDPSWVVPELPARWDEL